jgi:Holliday junction resolvase RusA-like endonuclease
MNRLLINAIFPGEPTAWQRVAGHGARVYKPKATRQAQARLVRGLKCVAPKLKPDSKARFGVQLVFSTKSFEKDGDNCEKLVLDAFNKKIWWDDSQIDACQWEMKRGAEIPQIHFIAYLIQ